ncbi:hypothetical protein HELRODRAFT_181965 [Helobdella robusta]|uniref:Uncharacterized protein n=1 Tax=Helobdella robusta TaxID=6412 RepID=T1FHJ1_HELRO|nr:hypothetical protein HELRODRAFT_181965 [Helobdella robusta]ESN91910.1 hypothetical protein HELRODRAFT_181965 [Helobdella robusta]
MEVNKSEKHDKIIPRGTTKKERLQDCIAILKHLKLSDLMDKCPIFVSSDLEKIPDMERRSSKMHHCSYADKVSSNLLISGIKTSHCNEVEKNNNEIKSSGTTSNTGNVNASIPKPIKKIIGIKVIDNCKLQAEKNLIKKTVFLMSNVKRCHRNDVIDFLKTSGINVISCFPVIKRSNQDISDPVNKDEEESTMFRVCVESCDGPKMKDPEIMLKHIIVREWPFGKNTNKNSDTTNKHG